MISVSGRQVALRRAAALWLAVALALAVASAAPPRAAGRAIAA